MCLFLIYTEANTKHFKRIPFKAINTGYRMHENILIEIYGQMKLLIILCYTQQWLEIVDIFQPADLLLAGQVWDHMNATFWPFIKMSLWRSFMGGWKSKLSFCELV